LMRKALPGVLLCLAVLAGPVVAGMPGIVLRDMDGKPVSVDSLLADGPVVLDFWATWCRPCRVEMPKLQEIQEALEGEHVHFAAVSLDTRQSKGRVEDYVSKNNVTLPVYRDPEGSLAKKFKITAIPTTILLDQDAEIAYSTRGYRPGDEVLLRKEIQALLAKRAKGEQEEEAPE
jgi:cytochrome c biogenesis protein CcmG/thiol:disulfide interchange protein DsbE